MMADSVIDDDFSKIPVIHFETYMNSQSAGGGLSEKARLECLKVAQCFHKFGILLIKDPRVDMGDNDNYIDLMEGYFATTGAAFYRGELVPDIKPENHYQVGATPEFIEVARDHSEKIRDLNLSREDTPFSPMTPQQDAKWRFMWKIGERPEGAGDDFPAVIPDGYPGWEDKMNTWGRKLHSAILVAAEMVAIGMGCSPDTFTKRMEGGAHLLAPTGSDLEKNDVGAVFAGFHYDISFMTIHGKSRFPGLYVWTRGWKKQAVKIPEGCLLIQAGTSFEHITGGYVLAGFHEVIYTEATKEACERRKAANQAKGIDQTIWRVSSTMFSHFRNDVDIGPLEELQHLYTPEEAAKYPRMSALDILMQELAATGMTFDDKQ